MDELRIKFPAIKLHKLRSLLRDVTCYRCPDQTARYVQDELDELIEEEEDLEESAREIVDADAKSSPQIFEMAMFQASMRGMSEVLKALGELRKMIGDISGAATEPLKLGLDLVKQNTELMAGRLAHYERYHDDTLTLFEALSSQQTDRDLKVERAKGAQKVREQALGAIVAYAPALLRDLKQSAQSSPTAAAALEAISSLEPDVFDAIVDADTHTPAQRAAWGKLRDMIKKPPDAKTDQQRESQAA